MAWRGVVLCVVLRCVVLCVVLCCVVLCLVLCVCVCVLCCGGLCCVVLCCVCCVVLFVCEMICDYPIVIMRDIINIKHVQFSSVTNVHMFMGLMLI